MLDFKDLPKLPKKQQQFVLRYSINDNNGAEAYRYAYDCKGSSQATINVEVNKLLKNPKIALWLEVIKANVHQVIQEEINYSAKECFDELSEIQQRAKEDKGNYSQEIKAVELKGKLAGHFVDKHQLTGVGLQDVLDKLK